MALKWKTLTVGPFAMNAYILWCSHTLAGILVDPGDEVDLLIKTIEEMKIKPERIIITHAHLDHVWHVKSLQQRLPIPLALHRDEVPVLQMLAWQAQAFGFEAPEPPRVDGYLAEGDEVRFGEVTMRILHAPGHSPGSIILYGEDIAVVGDVLFQGSIGRTDLPFGSYETLMRSIRQKLLTLPDHVRVLPGHGGETTIGAERRNNPFLQTEQLA
ncbi:MAG: MBL fold metallo-hydrolase [candidate division KSB1 bacterium]|nr:MBL fold metallo-hydrolase [candidate division KSB1 bacterium]MDZ7301333.1 MBL fold metallo-hydrolase [candidate division KSB1 bacterium]MDZ7310782.1 MBL fold metallo-hydrolase [candidate division KSB1 bacterium]